MGQEFFINSQELEDKIRQLLPSQGGAGAGFDLSASTQIVPVIDLTESAEGSNVRSDLQTALSFTSSTTFEVSNATDTAIITNTGYFRIFGAVNTTSTGFGNFELTDGVTQKRIIGFNSQTVNILTNPFDFIVFMSAGQSLLASASTGCQLLGVTRQLADIDGNLVNP